MVKCIKAPTPYFNISDYVTFCSANTRSSVHPKLKHTKTKTNLLGQFYFNRIPRLWNSLPQIDTSMSIPTLRCKLHTFFWNHFIENFNPTNVCSYHFVCPCQKCCRLPIRNCLHYIIIAYVLCFKLFFFVSLVWLLVSYLQSISTVIH